MNRRALRSKLLLKFRERKNPSVLPAVGRAQIEWIFGGKIGICSRDIFDFFKVIKVIRGNEDTSICSQRLAYRA